MPDADPDVEVAVVGGGISGLAAAWELHARRTPCVLFERSARLGGIVRTDRIDGFTIDGGPDALLAEKPAAIELCRELGLGDRLIPTQTPRTAFVLRAGRLHALPAASVLGIPTRLAPLAASRLLSAPGRARMALERLLPGRPPGAAEDESIAAFFGRRFGREAVDYIAEPLLAGIYAGDVERLSVRALFPRLVEAEQRHGSVLRAFAARRAPRPAADGPFRSLRGGVGELAAALAGALTPGMLRTGAGVATVAGRGPFRLALTTGEQVSARRVVLAVPAPAAAELVRPLDPELSALCGGVPCTSTAVVALGYPRSAVRHALRGSGFVVPRVERGVSLLAGTWVSSKWPHRAPRGHVLLRGFLGGARDGAVLARSDAELIDAAHRDFARLLGVSGAPVVARVYRWPRSNPQHEVGHLARMAAIDARLERLPGLHLIGAGFRGVGLPACVAHGRAAGASAAAGH